MGPYAPEQNKDLIRADGGQVIMTAGARNALLASVVNNTGVIEARTVESHDGSITLLGGMEAGTVNVGGTLDASASNGGNGGAIETNASSVKVANGTTVTTAAPHGMSGSWLIDPTDFTIAASGGDITGAQLSANLATGNVSISSNSGAHGTLGNVNVNDTVTWSANKLTLTAVADVDINAVMTANNTASLDLEPGSGHVNLGFNTSGGFSGAVNFFQANGTTPRSGTGFLTMNGVGYTVITSLGVAGSTTGTDLQGINGNLSGHYALGANIDATATSGWNSGKGFTPIGTTSSTSFTGVFDGLGHTITNLTVDQTTSNAAGLFGYISSTGIVRNVGMVGVNLTTVTGYDGAIADTNNGAIFNVYSTGTVTGGLAGGLVGSNSSTGTITNSFSSSTVSPGTGSAAGGLVGDNLGAITSSYASGSVSGPGEIGGLVGENMGATTGTITNSYATGNVSGTGYVGGLVGSNVGTIDNSHATGVVTGETSTHSVDAGGLVGLSSGNISSSYATGAVGFSGTGANVFLGGLVGSQNATISNSYATGNVSGTIEVGGLVALNDGSIINSHAQGSVSGTGNSVGGLVGDNNGGAIANSYATGNVSGNELYNGGLVGLNLGGTITNSYATGSVTGPTTNSSVMGGLVGWNDNGGSIIDSYATGAVTGSGSTYGGLVGFNYGSKISNSYATGNVSAARADVGGLVGENTKDGSVAGTITSSYSTGTVSGTTNLGGLVGYNSAGTTAITTSFWNTTTSGLSTSAGGTGMTTAQMQTQANFTSATSANGNVNPGWDFSGTWTMYNGETYPLLRSFLTPLTIAANNATVTYNRTAYDNPTGVTYSTPPGANLLGTLVYTANGQPAINAGTYTILPGGLYSNQQGYLITFASGTLTINPAMLTVSGESASNKVYNGNTTATLTGGSLSGVYAGDTVTLTQAGAFASKNVGNGIAVTATDSLGGASASNYVLTQPTGLSANITPATLTVTGESAANKVYDGTTTASFTGGSLSGVVSGDTVTLTQAGTFASKNVGNAIAVSTTDSIGGASASNYVLTQPTGLSANITPATLTVTGESAGNKVYDGTTTATLSGGGLSGVIAGDTVTLTQAGSFAYKNVGNGIAVTATDSLGGANAGNYVLTQPTGLSANITPATLTVTGESAANKVYDGTINATLTGGSLSGLVAGDAGTVSLNESGNFASKNVGNSIAVTATDTLGGTNAGNYMLVQSTGLSANITPATLTVTGASAANKVYDGTTTTSFTGGSLSGVVSGDTVTLTQAGTFASKNVGNGIAVTTTDSIGGTSASNYVLAQPTGLSANITPATLTVAGESAGNKVYDGTTTATLSGGSLSGLVAGDAGTVSLNESGNFASKNVGSSIAVTATDTLSGTNAGNYVVVQTTGLTANITPATLTVTGEAAGNKVYDGTTTATLTGGNLSGLVAGDAGTVNLTESGNFASKNVGNGIAVTASDTLSGTNAGNYVLVQSTGLSANITPATLTVIGEIANNKVYDGTTTATLSGGALSGIVSGDAGTVGLIEAGNFVSPNIGNGIAVIASDSLNGSNAGNYVLTQPTGLSANITP
jgi:phosphotransferase system IIA component